MRISILCRVFLITSCFLIISSLVLPSSGFCQNSSVEPKAHQLLKAMSDYVSGLKLFEIHTENTLEVVLHSGQKIQFDNPASLVLKRPDKFLATRNKDRVDQRLYFDGKMLTLLLKNKNIYASATVPPSIEAALDYARESLDLTAPASDLIFENSYELLMEHVDSGFWVGRSVVDNVQCHHLAFRGKDVDWQIWIQEGDKPLPRKFIITSKWITGSPQFCVHIREWNLSPKISEKMFQFIPPQGAQKVDFITTTQSAAK